MIRLAFCSSGCCRISAVSAADLPVLNRSTLTEMPEVFQFFEGQQRSLVKFQELASRHAGSFQRSNMATLMTPVTSTGLIDALCRRFRSRMLRQGIPYRSVGSLLRDQDTQDASLFQSVFQDRFVVGRDRIDRQTKRLPSE